MGIQIVSDAKNIWVFFNEYSNEVNASVGVYSRDTFQKLMISPDGNTINIKMDETGYFAVTINAANGMKIETVDGVVPATITQLAEMLAELNQI